MTPKKPVGKPAEPFVPVLVPQPHGGALLTGGVAGNRGQLGGHIGRPKDAIREKLARIVDEDGVGYVGRVLRGEEVGASIQNRLDAFDKAARYSIGAVKGVEVDDVRERLQRTLEIIMAELPADVSEPLLGKIELVWR